MTNSPQTEPRIIIPGAPPPVPDEVSASLPGLGTFELKSTNALLVLVIVGLFITLGGVLYSVSAMISTELTNVRMDHTKIITAITADATVRAAEQVKLVETLDTLIYIMSLPEGKRPPLMMPRSLRERLRQSQGEP